MDNQSNVCPETNLVWAILCTAMCCLPLGIVAIIKATSVEKLWAEGRYEEAEKASSDAKKFALIGAVGAAVLVALYMLFYVFLFAFAYS